MSDTSEERRYLDEAGLALYDSKIKDYIAEQSPLVTRYDFATPAGSSEVTFTDGEWIESMQCMRFCGLVEVSVPEKGEYKITVTTTQAAEQCTLTVAGESYAVGTGPGHTIFTVQAEDVISMTFSANAWVRSITLVGQQHIPTKMSEMVNDVGYLSGGNVVDGVLHIKNN